MDQLPLLILVLGVTGYLYIKCRLNIETSKDICFVGLRTSSGMVQAEEFKALMQQVMKAHTADLEAIQITQRVRSATPNSPTIPKLKISLLCPGASWMA